MITEREALKEQEITRNLNSWNKIFGRIKQGEGPMIGNAGEYAVMAELLKRGIVAGLTPRNTPGFDIIATANTHTANVRVKTKTEDTQGWQWNAHAKTREVFTHRRNDGDFVVLVDLGNAGHPNRYFVVPTVVIDSWLKTDFDTWLASPGRDPNKPHSEDNLRRILRYNEYVARLHPYKEAWAILFETPKDVQGPV
ncbi:MAG: hypothetical protein M1596_05400 [Firmicutes bacterium]|nr:hypothetical protein [Bacillota bacterium]